MVIIHVTSPRANDGSGVAGGGGGGIGRVAGAPLLQSDAAPATGDWHWSSITVAQLLSPCISGDDVVVVESFVNVIVCLIAEDRLYSICKCSVQ